MKTKWPWITMVLALLLAFLPPVRDVINSAFFSGEQLARTLGKLVLMEFAGIVFLLGIVEWGIRWYTVRRRATAANRGADAPHQGELSG